MFDTEKIAIQALQRADETKAERKKASRRTAAILGVCTAGLGGFFLAFSSGILPLTNENANIDIDDTQVPLASFPDTEKQGINLGDNEVTLINEDSAAQYRVMVVGEENDYALPDGRYQIMVGDIEIGTLTLIEGSPEITLK